MGADQNIAWSALAASTLDWWQEAGVDITAGDAPCDWLAVPPVLPAAPPPAGSATMPDTIEAFAEWRLGPDAPEGAWPGRRLGAEGDPASALAIVTDWPEREDLTAGRLLSGQDGRLLDRMLAAIGLERGHVYLLPISAARPPAGRADPEVAVRLAEATRQQLSLATPERVLLLGNAASRAVLAMDCTAARGTVHAINHRGGAARVIASFHPRLLLQRPMAKADAWRDLMRLMGDGE